MALTTAQQNAVARDITISIATGMRMAQTLYPTICTIVPSMSADENYGWVGALPQMREWLGDRVFHQLRAATYLLPNKHWESSLEVPRTVVDDDRLGTLRPQLNQLGNRARRHPDKLLFENAVNVGDSELCFDGQFFFDTDHLWGDSGPQSNKLTFTVTDTADVKPDEFKAAFEFAYTTMLGFRDDRGEPLVEPRIDNQYEDIQCMIPPALWPAANTAFRQTLSLEGGAATSNVLLNNPNVIPATRMGANYPNGSDVKFQVLHTGDELKPYVFQDREPLQAQTKGPGDIEHKDYKTMTEARYNIGFLAWWNAVEVTFTT